MAKKKKAELKRGGVTNKGTLYAYASKNGIEIIDFLVATMRNETLHHSVRISAANKLIDKMLADVKAIELTGENHGPLQIHITEEAFRVNEDQITLNE